MMVHHHGQTGYGKPLMKAFCKWSTRTLCVLRREHFQALSSTQDAATTAVEAAPELAWPPTWFRSNGDERNEWTAFWGDFSKSVQPFSLKEIAGYLQDATKDVEKNADQVETWKQRHLARIRRAWEWRTKCEGKAYAGEFLRRDKQMLEVMIALDKSALCSSRKHGEGRSSYEIKHVFYGQSFNESGCFVW